MATIRLFAAARDAAGTGRDTLPGSTVGEILDLARDRYGARFAEVLDSAQVWRNGEPAALTDAVDENDEVAVLPPVSGGSEAVGRSGGEVRCRGRAAESWRRSRRAWPVRSPTVWSAGTTRPVRACGSDSCGRSRSSSASRWVPWPFAVVLAVVAGAAGAQTAAAWRRVGGRANRAVAGLTALLMPLAAAMGTATLGLVAMVAAWVALAAAALDGHRRRTIWADAGLTLRSGYPVGLAAGSMLVIRHLEIGAAVSLVLLMFAYDLGDFIVGTEASSPVEGPIAGMVAAMVIAFALGVFTVPPFSLGSALVFGGLAAALFPLGQLTATELLPAADARAPSLRRVDTLVLAAPVWMVLLWRFIG